jgi:hypothetical protein
MDYPIEIYVKPENNKNNLYYRYYICSHKKINDDIEYYNCNKVKFYTEINTEIIKKSKIIKISEFIPSYFDNFIVKYNLHKSLKIVVKK